MKSLRSKTEVTYSKFTLTLCALFSPEQLSELPFSTFSKLRFGSLIWKIEQVLLRIFTRKSSEFSQYQQPEHFASALNTHESNLVVKRNRNCLCFRKNENLKFAYFFFSSQISTYQTTTLVKCTLKTPGTKVSETLPESLSAKHNIFFPQSVSESIGR